MRQLQEAVELHNRGELDHAESIYRDVLAFDPNNFFALRYLGCLYRLKENYVEGIALLRKAVSLRPTDVDCLFNLGNILGASGFHQHEAISVFQSCLALRDDFAEAKESLGCILFQIGELSRSEEVLVSAVKSNPGLFQAWMNLGNTLKEKQKPEEAIASYRKAIAVKPDFVEAYLNLASVLEEEGEVEQAIASYRKAIEVKPDFLNAKKALLQCQGQNGIRQQVPLEDYRGQMEGNDEAGILIAAYQSFNEIPSGRRSVNSWVEDKNEGYFAGQMFGPTFYELPWVKSKSFAHSSALQIPEAGTQFLDTVDIYYSTTRTLQIRMSQAPVISSLLESIYRKKKAPIDVIDVGGWSGNALFLAGFNDSWDIVKTWEVVETNSVCIPARDQLPAMLDSLPDESAGKRNLTKLSFKELESFYGGSSDLREIDLIYSCGSMFYESQFTDRLDNLVSRGASVVFLHSHPYLVSKNPNLNVCEIAHHRESKSISFLCSLGFLSQIVSSLAKRYGYSWKIWSEYIEPKIVFWQPQEGDSFIPEKVKEDAKPLLLKVCSIRLDKLD